jgi:two-component system sensor histidine kinase/response regulator
MNNDGVWNKKPTIYSFEIDPPYWKTIWFNLGLIVVSLLIIYLIFKLRTERLRDQKRKLEQEKLRLESEIRDRKAAEKKLNENEKALKEANEELNMLIWRSYHDLRGPATTIQGLVNVAMLSSPIDVKYLKMIKDTTLRLDSILKDLFKVSNIRHQEHYIEPINILENIQEVLQEISLQHHINNYDLTIDINEEGIFHCDKTLFKLLIFNILNNSFCYSPEGSKITIKGKIHQKTLKLLISDNGIGIHESITKKVFEMFYKGTAKSKGNGLGLYMVHKILEILSGSVKILSKEDKGTAVLLRIKSMQGKTL